MESIKINELAEYCKSINTDCLICEKQDACTGFVEKIEDISPIGIVKLVNNNEEILFYEKNMKQELKYSSENLFDIKCMKEGLSRQINELNIQKRVIDGKIELLYETIAALERHILSVEEQNK